MGIVVSLVFLLVRFLVNIDVGNINVTAQTKFRKNF